MADIIDFAKAKELAKVVAEEAKLAAAAGAEGMSLSAIAKQMGYKATSNPNLYLKTVTKTVATSATAATAGEAIAGASATGAASTTTGTVALTTTAEGATVMGVATVLASVAACALTAVAGYKVGNLIYENNQEFFDGMFESLSEFLTGDEKTLAFLFDDRGNTYLPRESKEALLNYFNSVESNQGYRSVEFQDYKIPFKHLGRGDCFEGGRSSNPNDEHPQWNEVEGIRLDGSSTIVNDEVFALGLVHDDATISNFIFSKNRFYIGGISHWWRNGWQSSLVSLGGCQKPMRNSKPGYPVYLLIHSPIADCIKNYPQYYTLPLTRFSGDISSADKQLELCEKILYGDTIPPEGPTIPDGMTKYDVPDTDNGDWTKVQFPEVPDKFPPEIPEYNPDAEPDLGKIDPLIPYPRPVPEDEPNIKPLPNPNPNPIILPSPLPDPNPKPEPAPNPGDDPSIDPGINPNDPPADFPGGEDEGGTKNPTLPVIPPFSAGAGLLHVYNPTQLELDEFGNWLWSTFSGEFIDVVAKLFNNPMDAVIGLHEIYCTPITNGSRTIRAGFLDSTVASRLVSQRYVELNCGAITVPEYWGNYLDYSPYTKVYCYLPFIGIVELNTDDIIGHGVQVLYKIDTYNGSCIAMIITARNTKTEKVVYQFSGNCAVEVPITSGTRSAILGGIMSAVTGGLTGGAVGATVGAIRGAMMNKNSVQHSGSFGASFGALGIKKPYIIVKRPQQKVVPGYNTNYGYPAHKMVHVAKCTGYLRAREVEVVSATATEEEKKRIERLLKEGVFV